LAGPPPHRPDFPRLHWHPKSQALNGARDTLTEAERWALGTPCAQTGWEYGL